MLVNIDSVSIGCYVRMGDTLCKKVSPMICTSVETGELVYDARLYPQWKHVDAPNVEYVGRVLPNPIA